MTALPVCFESENQSICLDPDAGDILMSLPPEPKPSPTTAKWTPRDQVEWNRITAQHQANGGGHHSPLGMKPPKALGIPFFLAGCGGDSGYQFNPMNTILEEDLIDNDGDGFFSNGNDLLDCNDENERIHPNAEEVCNDEDDNCDGNTDEDLKVDNDADGFYSDECGDDCDDRNNAINPEAHEITGNNVDENCNGMSDADPDNDGFSSVDGDCNETDPAINSRAQEITGNGIDENCNGMGDADRDGDGVSFADGDCDDADPAIGDCGSCGPPGTTWLSSGCEDRAGLITCGDDFEPGELDCSYCPIDGGDWFDDAITISGDSVFGCIDDVDVDTGAASWWDHDYYRCVVPSGGMISQHYSILASVPNVPGSVQSYIECNVYYQNPAEEGMPYVLLASGEDPYRCHMDVSLVAGGEYFIVATANILVPYILNIEGPFGGCE